MSAIFDYLAAGGTTLKIRPKLVANGATKTFDEFQVKLPSEDNLVLSFDSILNTPVTNASSVGSSRSFGS